MFYLDKQKKNGNRIFFSPSSMCVCGKDLRTGSSRRGVWDDMKGRIGALLCPRYNSVGTLASMGPPRQLGEQPLEKGV